MLFKRLLLLFLVIVAVQLQVRLWIGESSFAHVSGMDKKVEIKKARISIKEQRNKILRAETKELKQGLESIEEMARTELGMIKSGETFFLVLDGESADGRIDPEGLDFERLDLEMPSSEVR